MYTYTNEIIVQMQFELYFRMIDTEIFITISLIILKIMQYSATGALA